MEIGDSVASILSWTNMFCMNMHDCDHTFGEAKPVKKRGQWPSTPVYWNQALEGHLQDEDDRFVCPKCGMWYQTNLDDKQERRIYPREDLMHYTRRKLNRGD